MKRFIYNAEFNLRHDIRYDCRALQCYSTSNESALLVEFSAKLQEG
jgi:hypothetical protein